MATHGTRSHVLAGASTCRYDDRGRELQQLAARVSPARVLTAMRMLFVAVLLAAATVRGDSLADPGGMDPSCRGHEANRETYLRELEYVVNAGRMELVDELIAEDYVNHSAPPGAPQGRAAIRGYLAIMKKAFPDRTVRNEMLLCAGDYVIVRSTVTGTSLGPYFGRPPTGKSFSVMGTDIYRVRDGQLRGRWGNEDALGMMVQLGYVEPESAMRPPRKDAAE